MTWTEGGTDDPRWSEDGAGRAGSGLATLDSTERFSGAREVDRRKLSSGFYLNAIGGLYSE